jgi:RNA polymerase sigma-70 factor (ECF subfamily)
MGFPLCEVLIRARDALGAPATRPSEALEQTLARALADARDAWPTLHVTDSAYVTYLAERLDPKDDVATAIEKTKSSDLYLTCACARGDADAIAAFDSKYLRTIDSSLQRMKLPPSALDEAKQVLRHTLFIGNDDSPPKITEYRGLGSLQGWVRASTVRASFRAMYQPRGQVDVDRAVLEDLPASADVELDYLRRTYGSGFGQGLKEAFGALTAEERNLLRHHFGHGLTIDDLASLYKVHRATAARRLAMARQALADATREALAAKFGVKRSEVSSLMRLIDSQLNVTLESLFRAAADEK